MKTITHLSSYYRYFFISLCSLSSLLQASDADESSESQIDQEFTNTNSKNEKENIKQLVINEAGIIARLPSIRLEEIDNRDYEKVTLIDSEKLDKSEFKSKRKRVVSLAHSPEVKQPVYTQKVQDYLSSLGIEHLWESMEENINTEMLDQELNRHCCRRLVTWMTLDSWWRKCGIAFLVRKKDLQAPDHREDKDAECACSQFWWTQNNSLSYYNSTMRRLMISVEAVEQSFETSVGRIWSLLLLAFKLDALNSYLRYPDSRIPGTNLWNIAFQGTEQSVFYTFLSNPYVWKSMLILPSAFMAYKTSRAYCGSGKPLDKDKGIQEVLDYPHQYSCKRDTLCMYVPCANLAGGLMKAKYHVQQNSTLDLEKRRELFDALVYIARQGTCQAQSMALDQLLDIAHGIGLSDFPKLKEAGVPPKTISLMLSMKLDAIKVLQEMSKLTPPQVENLDDNYRSLAPDSESKCCLNICCSRLRALPRYFHAQYNCWHLGHHCLPALQIPFYATKSWKFYSKVTFFLALYSAISAVIRKKMEEIRCKKAGKVWSYLPQIQDSACSWCADLNVAYATINNPQGCWDSFLSQAQSQQAIIELIQRFNDFQAVGIVNTTLNAQTTDLPFMVNVSPILLRHAGAINTLSFGTLYLYAINSSYVLSEVIHPNATSCSILKNALIKTLSINWLVADDARAIDWLNCLPADFLQEIAIKFSFPAREYSMPHQLLESAAIRSLSFRNLNKISFSNLTNISLGANLSRLDLSSNYISNISSLALLIPHNNLNTLNLCCNNISDISSLAKALPSSSLSTVDLSSNFHISNISVLAKYLPDAILSKLDLSYNQISDISSLAQSLPNSSLSYLDLSSNQISDTSVLFQSLLGSSLSYLDLEYNIISDVSGFAQGLPNSSLSYLDLSDNRITDISGLAQGLTDSSLASLDLSFNYGISNISTLAQALPNSPLNSLDLFSTNISDISSLAQFLPYSSLASLDLSWNPISNISPLAQALPNSSLSMLFLGHNPISDISPLAETLPNSTLSYLDLSYNHISNISALAHALPNSSLNSLDLSYNLIRNISILARAIPRYSLSYLNLWLNLLTDITELAEAIPGSSLSTLDLGDNYIRDIIGLTQALGSGTNLTYIDLDRNPLNDTAAILLSQSLVREPSWWTTHSWFTALLPSERHVISDIEATNPQLETIILGDSYTKVNKVSNISTVGVKSLCDILPGTPNLGVCHTFLYTYSTGYTGLCFGAYGDHVDTSIVDPDTCYIPSSASMDTPSSAFGIFFCLGLALMRLLDIV